MSVYLLSFSLAFFLSIIASFLVYKLAIFLKILDIPSDNRRLHTKPVPLLGGLAIFLSFFTVLYFYREHFFTGNLEPKHLIGVFLGACFLMLGGYLDDKYNLKPHQQIVFPLLAIIAVVIGGVGIEKITNPLGGFIYLNKWKIQVLTFNNLPYYFTVLSDSFTIIWLLGMMYTTKLLDGVDGLVTGISAIGAFIIFLFTMTTKYYQPDVGLMALIFSAACLGFLIFNFHPAKIFLGEGGSLLTGFILGVLAIISGGKIAIALLIMGIPILDLIWTIARRLLNGKNPFKFPDKLHLHHRLIALGFSQRQTVLIYYFIATVFGLSALFLQSKGKLLAIGILTILMIIIASISVVGYKIKS